MNAERADAVRAMLEARSVAVVGASDRPGSFGERLLVELDRSPSRPAVHLVNPRHASIGGRPCVASLDDIGGPVDLVALAVGDTALEAQLAHAAGRGDRAAVIYGSAFDDPDRPGRRDRLQATAAEAGMALCGAGCMGFVNVARGLRAIGYLEPDPLPEGPVALITHSGSAFSALLRADRGFGWTVAVSSGQELVTSTADYLDYAVGLEGTRVVALLLETLRRPDALRAALRRAAEAGVTVVTLTVGGSPGGRAMVEAHSGALAGDDAAWEALCDATGMLRVADLAEMCDTLELLSSPRRARRTADPPLAAEGRPGRGLTGRGVATVHDSGAERALVVDLADRVGVPFAAISEATTARLAALLDPGLEPTNPLDVWGTGAAARQVFAGSLVALADDPAVDAVALCVDLVHELDGDESYVQAVGDAWAATTIPLCVLTNLPSAVDRAAARRLRDAGVPVLEGTRSGLLALRHLLAAADRGTRPAEPEPPPVLADRQARWQARLTAGPLGATDGIDLLADYGIAHPPSRTAGTVEQALEAAEAIGYPVVVKTDRAGLAHKSDVGGVTLGVTDPTALRAAYADMTGRLGPDVIVTATAAPGVEMTLGIVRDPLLGPLVIVGAGGVLVELLADRAVGLPPLDDHAARRMIDRLRTRPLLDGYRGVPGGDIAALADTVVAVATMATELDGALDALDINPLRCGPGGAVALDVLVEARRCR